MLAGSLTVLGLMLLVASTTFTLGLAISTGLPGLTWCLLLGLPAIVTGGGLFLLGRWLGARIESAPAAS